MTSPTGGGDRRQKIIVSVTGIFIVLLVLLGLTYAYFLTRITGNSNPTSISVTTANLELVYGDGTTSILTSSNPIEPGKFSSSKDFTVTNNGNSLTDYAVTLEDFSITYANDTVIDGVSVKAGTVTKMEYPSDMKMAITCVIESDDEDRNGQLCGNTNGTLPTENSILLTNSIEVDDVHKYVLTLTYVDSGIDQSKDMNKTIKGKIDIIDPKSTIDLSGSVASYQRGDYVEINSTPIKSEIIDGKYKIIGVEPGSHTLNIKYKDDNGNIQTRGSQTLTIKKGDEANISGTTITFTDTSRTVTVDVTESYDLTVDETVKSSLRDAIIANAMSSKNGTQFVLTPPSKVAEEISLINWDNGTEGIVYGSINDYRNYGDNEGSGSNDYAYTGKWDLGIGYYGYTDEKLTINDILTNVSLINYTNSESSNESMRFKLENWLEESNIDKTKLKKDNWCIGNTKDAYNSTTGEKYNDTKQNLIRNGISFIYDTNKRLKGIGETPKATFNCNMENYETYESYIATLTADEIVFAGSTLNSYYDFVRDNPSYFYLINPLYATDWSTEIWTLSPAKYQFESYTDFQTGSDFALMQYLHTIEGYWANTMRTIRPAITLKINTLITTGEGTQSNPYIVE